MQVDSKCSEETKIVFVCFLVFCSKVLQLTVDFLRRDSGGIALMRPIGISLSRAANIDRFVSLKNLHFVLVLSFVHVSITSVFFEISFNLPCRFCYSQVLTVPTGCCSHEHESI